LLLSRDRDQMTEIVKDIQICGSNHKPILLDVFYEPTTRAKPIVIFSHGFKGFKDWGHFNLIAKTFAEAGFVFVKFNFSFNGTTPQNSTDFTDLEAFGNNNYMIELNDLEKVIDWVLSFDPIRKEIDSGQIFLTGHSRGGGISILKAAEDSRIKKITTWASVSDFIDRNKQSTVKNWKEMGVVHTFNGRTKQQMPLYYQFYKTLQKNKERLNILKAAQKLVIPFLIVHGTCDEAVSDQDARELNVNCKHSKLLLIEGAGHTFEAKHPFEGEIFPTNAEFIIRKTIEFFNEK
jgi:dipeptidyl aminopeptidase/acylaminoacyl peptidase